MNITAATWLVLLLALAAANLPFLTERPGLVGPRQQKKRWRWRLLELLLLYLLTLAAGHALESHLGQAQRQGWEFYVAMGCLFLTLAFPGFVWRFLRRR
jgi:hypothetical protein